MTALPYPDRFHVHAALGWLMLENPREAEAEFRKLSRSYDTHPDYLQVRCRLLIAARQWPEGLETSRQQLRIAPDRPHGWINRAYCLHELKRTAEALCGLIPAAKRFPKHDLIAFNLACYSCQLGRLTDALHWVNRTIRILADHKTGAAHR